MTAHYCRNIIRCNVQKNRNHNNVNTAEPINRPERALAFDCTNKKKRGKNRAAMTGDCVISVMSARCRVWRNVREISWYILNRSCAEKSLLQSR